MQVQNIHSGRIAASLPYPPIAWQDLPALQYSACAESNSVTLYVGIKTSVTGLCVGVAHIAPEESCRVDFFLQTGSTLE